MRAFLEHVTSRNMGNIIFLYPDSWIDCPMGLIYLEKQIINNELFFNTLENIIIIFISVKDN